jgi:hypothetical protein
MSYPAKEYSGENFSSFCQKFSNEERRALLKTNELIHHFGVYEVQVYAFTTQTFAVYVAIEKNYPATQ